MPACFLCNECLPSIDALKVHFTFIHNVQKNSQYQCKESGCYYNFQSWAQFRRHLNSNHVCSHPNISKYISKLSDEREDVFHDLPMEISDERTEDAPPQPSVKDFGGEFRLQLLGFIGRLYANPRLPRSHVQVMLEETKSLLGSITSLIIPTVVGALEVHDTASPLLSEVKSLTSILEDCFVQFSTEHRRLKVLADTGCLIVPKAHTLGHAMEKRKRDNIMIQEIVPQTAEFIPLRQVFHSFFSLPGVFAACKAYMENLEQDTEVLSNFVQGELWRNKKSKYFSDKLVFPLFVYYDDLEVNNPLGSHKCVSKLGATYVTIPCLPLEFRSTLDNIFLALLIHSLDRAKYGNDHVFNILVDEINFLQRNGITLTIDGSTVTLYFALGLLLGDNLALNQIMGFVEGFTANYFCRFCKRHRDDTNWDLVEHSDFLRNIADYPLDVSSPVEESGVTEYSIWNKIDYFHVYDNYASDPLLHELAEGAGKRAMRRLLYHYIKQEKCFTLDRLNQRLKCFNYKLSGISNRPPLISDQELADLKIHMSGSEMINFIYLFPFLVGDLVPHDEVWEFYLTLRQLLKIVSAKSVCKESVNEVRYLVGTYLTLYIELFGEHLKAKEHIMLHWPRIMLMSGPLSHISTMRMESKNRLFKVRSNATTSRVNITFTTALKEQLQLCYRLAGQVGFSSHFEIGTPENIDFESFEEEDYNLSDIDLGKLRENVEVPWVNAKGTLYKVGMCLALYYESEIPVFGEIERIFCNQEQSVNFLCRILCTDDFDEHLDAYEFSRSTKYSVVNHNDLWCYLPTVHTETGDGQNLIFMKT